MMSALIGSPGFSRRRFLRYGATSAGAVAAGATAGHLPMADALPTEFLEPVTHLARAVLDDLPDAITNAVTPVTGTVSSVLLPPDFNPVYGPEPTTPTAIIRRQYNQSPIGIYATPTAYLLAALDMPYGATLKQVDAFFVVPGTTAQTVTFYVDNEQVAGAGTVGTAATATGTGLVQATASGLSLKAISPVYQLAATVSTSVDKWLCGAVYQYLPVGPRFVPITPTRVYDSRSNPPLGPLTDGGTRVVSVATGFTPGTNTVSATNVVPTGAIAIAYNLTVTETVGGGYVYVAPGDATSIAGSSINWMATGQTLANGLVVKLDSLRQVKAFVVGPSTQFILDVLGFYVA
jgi:hypothetical protein